MRLLLEHGEDPTARTSAGTTAAHIAAASGHAPALRCLLAAAPATARAADSDGQTPLHLAARAGAVGCVRALLQVLAPPSSPEVAAGTATGDLDLADVWGRTPIQWAVSHGHQCCADALLAAGATSSVLAASVAQSANHEPASPTPATTPHLRRRHQSDLELLRSHVETVRAGAAAVDRGAQHSGLLVEALLAIKTLVCTSVPNREAVRGLGLVPLLAALLAPPGHVATSVEVVGIVHNLCHGNEANRRALRDGGCIAPVRDVLARCLEAVGGDASQLRGQPRALAFKAVGALCMIGMSFECAPVVVESGALPLIDQVFAASASAGARNVPHPGLLRLQAAARKVGGVEPVSLSSDAAAPSIPSEFL